MVEQDKIQVSVVSLSHQDILYRALNEIEKIFFLSHLRSLLKNYKTTSKQKEKEDPLHN